MCGGNFCVSNAKAKYKAEDRIFCVNFCRPATIFTVIICYLVFKVPKDFGFKVTILAESSPNVNILPATPTILR